MNFRFVPEAELELVDAALWYEDQRPGLGLEFEAEVRRSIDVILEAPNRWPEVKAGYRRFRTDRFPYSIVYRLPSKNVVEIVAVAHGKRRPGYWSRR